MRIGQKRVYKKAIELSSTESKIICIKCRVAKTRCGGHFF